MEVFFVAVVVEGRTKK